MLRDFLSFKAKQKYYFDLKNVYFWEKADFTFLVVTFWGMKYAVSLVLQNLIKI